MLNQPRLLFLIAFACLTCACPSQRVVMPGGAGGVTPPAGWTVLRKLDLEADERATDPTGEPTLDVRVAPGSIKLLQSLVHCGSHHAMNFVVLLKPEHVLREVALRAMQVAGNA